MEKQKSETFTETDSEGEAHSGKRIDNLKALNMDQLIVEQEQNKIQNAEEVYPNSDDVSYEEDDEEHAEDDNLGTEPVHVWLDEGARVECTDRSLVFHPENKACLQRTVERQQEQDLLLKRQQMMQHHNNMRFSDSNRLEHQPLIRAFCEVSSSPAPRASFWGICRRVMQARPSLPFLGCDSIEGPLPPTPKPATYKGDFQRVGASLLSFIPCVWKAKANCQIHRQTHMRQQGKAFLDDVSDGDGGSGGSTGAHHAEICNCNRICHQTPLLRISSDIREKQQQKASRIQHAFLSRNAPAAPLPTQCRQAIRPVKSMWRSKRVAYETTEIMQLLFTCLRRRLSSTVIGAAFLLPIFVLLYVYIGALIRNFSGLSFDVLRGTARLEEAEVCAGDGVSNFTTLESKPSIYLTLQEEIRELRKQVEYGRDTLVEFKNRVRIDFERQFENLRKQLQREIHQQHEKKIQDVVLNLWADEYAAVAKRQGDAESESRISLTPFHAIQIQTQELTQKNAALLLSVEDLQKQVQTLSKQCEAGALQGQAGLISADWERKLKDLYTYVLLENEERIDWALESLGAVIVVSETVSSFAGTAFPWASKVSSRLEELIEDERINTFSGMGKIVRRPNVMLQPDRHPGNCYPFYGEKGNVTILLPTAVVVTSVAIDDVASEHFPDSAPRKFRLWGYEDDHSTQRSRQEGIQGSQRQFISLQTDDFAESVDAERKRTLAEGAKLEDKARRISTSSSGAFSSLKTLMKQLQDWVSTWVDSISYGGGKGKPRHSLLRKVYLGEYEVLRRQKFTLFKLARKHAVPLRKITFEFIENFGHSYTCIYRLRVHGDKAGLQKIYQRHNEPQSAQGRERFSSLSAS